MLFSKGLCYLARDWNPKVATDGQVLSTLNAIFAHAEIHCISYIFKDKTLK
jgi:hypothetical protein